tara:strand:+ start:29 stop:373 length:345 start_codon:yes stop_codon:yes gene_type:complete
MKININKKNYTLKFGFGALKILCKKWNEKTIGGLDKHFQKLNFADGKEPELDQWDLIGDLALSGLEYANKEVVFSSDEIVDVLFAQPQKLTELIEAFATSLPNNEPANPETRGK